MKANVPAFHLFFQSSGGSVGDGIALYNYFKTLTLDLTIYNPGSVCSIATIAYLGAKRRKTSANAIFTVHPVAFQFPQPAKASDLKPRAKTLAIDDRRAM
jgi:ATP-dependent protease ClpP protease subunit